MELFQSLFKRSASPLVGIDISSSSIKVVELSRKRDGTTVLERCAIERLQPGWVISNNVEKFEEVVQSLNRALRKAGITTKNAALALPPAAVFSKKVMLPANLPEMEMEAQTEAEVQQFVPIAVEELNIDYFVLGPNKVSPDELDVMVVAASKESVQDRLAVAEAAGLKPQVLDMSTLACRRAIQEQLGTIPGPTENKVVALFEIGANTTDLQIIIDDNVVYEREIGIGGGQLTQLIERTYGFSFEEAESKKRSRDLPEGYDTAVLQPFVMNASIEIERALQNFYASSTYNKVDGIILGGGGATLSGLPRAVSSQTGTPCVTANPFEDMQISSHIQERKLRREAPSYLTACGLAMRRFSA